MDLDTCEHSIVFGFVSSPLRAVSLVGEPTRAVGRCVRAETRGRRRSGRTWKGRGRAWTHSIVSTSFVSTSFVSFSAFADGRRRTTCPGGEASRATSTCVDGHGKDMDSLDRLRFIHLVLRLHRRSGKGRSFLALDDVAHAAGDGEGRVWTFSIVFASFRLVLRLRQRSGRGRCVPAVRRRRRSRDMDMDMDGRGLSRSSPLRSLSFFGSPTSQRSDLATT